MPPKKLEPTDIEWQMTADGSITGRRQDLGIHYRSIYGARTESQHVFIQGTALPTRTMQWNVGELGFGLGCNFSYTACAAAEIGVQLFYQAIDVQPPPPESIPPNQPYASLIKEVLIAAREQNSIIEHQYRNIRLRLYPFHWCQTVLTPPKLDAVFHDPFAPADNPESWSDTCFSWWKQWAGSHTRLATYSAAGHVRRALAKAGFWVARAPGPGKKREITIASPSRIELDNLDLITKYKPQ